MEKVVALPTVVCKEGHHVVTDVHSCAWGGEEGERTGTDTLATAATPILDLFDMLARARTQKYITMAMLIATLLGCV